MAVLVCPDDSVPEVYAILLNSAPVRAPAACQPPAAPAAPRARAAPALASGLTRRARRWLIQRARALPQAAPELQPALARARARLAAARLPILAAPQPHIWTGPLRPLSPVVPAPGSGVGCRLNACMATP